MLSLVIIIMVVGTVSATSENLKNEITSLVGWYERANIAENMLDVLTRSPGEPEDWEKNIASVIVPGLRSLRGNNLDYSKVMALVEGVKAGNPSLQSALWDLSNGYNFKLMVSMPNQSVQLVYNYTISPVSGAELLTACSVGELGNHSDTPVLINASQCSQGEFDFTHRGVSFGSYYNPYYVCVYGNTKIGDNFKVNISQYLAVNGSLDVGSAGWLSTSAIYVTGDAHIGSSGYATNIKDDSYIGGALDIRSNGHATFGKNLYVYGDTTVRSSGYLTVNESLYSLGSLDVQSNGNVNVSNDLYVGGDATVGNSGKLWVGGNLFVNGNFNGQSSLRVYVGGTAFVNGSLSLPSGNLKVEDELYVNGDFSQNPSTTVDVYGDAFINGDMKVAGTNIFHRDLHVNGDLTIDSGRRLVVYGNLYVDGDLTIDWNSKLIVYGNLYVSGKLTVRGTLIVKGNVYEYYDTQPPIGLESGNPFYVNGWLYAKGDTWYAMNGTGTSQSSYSFDGYRYNLMTGRWKHRDVLIYNNEILLGYYYWDDFWEGWFYQIEFEMMSVNWNFDIQINGTGSLSLPPDKDEAFDFDLPSLLMPPAPEFQYPECRASGEGSSVSINVTSVNVTYEFSPEKSAWVNISMVGGFFVSNENLIEQSMENSTWIQHSERTVRVSYRTYNQSYTVAGNKKVLLYEGMFSWMPLGALNVTVPDSDGNFTLISSFSTGNTLGIL